MNYFVYQMNSKDVAPNMGDMKEWLRFYKWGRPEVVTFRKKPPHFEGIATGDVLFFAMDGFLIGDGQVVGVSTTPSFVSGEIIQEIDIAEGGIWEYIREIMDTYDLDSCGAPDAYKFYRELGEDGAPRGRIAVYNENEEPFFFSFFAQLEKK